MTATKKHLLQTGLLLVFASTFYLSPSQSLSAELNDQQKADWEHRSMGANPFPYLWFKALNSVTHMDAKKKVSQLLYGTHLQNQLRYGLQESENNTSIKQGMTKMFLLPTTGLTVSWSNETRTETDAYIGEDELIRNIGGSVSAKFVGINCALCHQSTFRANGQKKLILGAPSQVDINGFYTDIVMSTIGLFVKKDLLISFLERVKQQNPELKTLNVRSEAKKLQRQFRDDVTFVISEGKPGLLNLAYYYTMLTAKIFSDKTEFRKIKVPIKSAYLRLFRLTHNLSESAPLGEIEDFANWFSERSIGDPDYIEKTSYYFGRSDAMGSLGNAEIRKQDLVHLTAPVGLPWVWGTQYMSFAHYTANMNNPVHRNIGAALAVGATYSAEFNRTSINLAAVKELEKIMHQMPPPAWEKVFAEHTQNPDFQINSEMTDLGRGIYQKKCATCHETNKFVGPAGKLRDYKLYSLTEMGTDPNEALNLAQPVYGESFAKLGSNLTEQVAAIYFTKNQISTEKQAEILETELRGPPIMRETFLGHKNDFGDQFDYFSVDSGAGYKARHLSGVWATAPFLHNDSVPTLADLLTPAIDRPVAFYVSGNFEFDFKNVGLKTVRLEKCDITTTPLGSACIDTTVTGNSNRGHEFGTTDLTELEKLSLIEYLKILPPEPEYAF